MHYVAKCSSVQFVHLLTATYPGYVVNQKTLYGSYYVITVRRMHFLKGRTYTVGTKYVNVIRGMCCVVRYTPYTHYITGGTHSRLLPVILVVLSIPRRLHTS